MVEVKFNGRKIEYANGVSIECDFDESFDCYSFHVSVGDDCHKSDLCYLADAHRVALELVEANND